MSKEKRKHETTVIQRKIEDLLESIPEGFYLTITGFDEDEIAVLERTSPGIYEERLNIQSDKIFG